MIRNTLAIIGILLAALLVLTRGLWYPGVTGEQKAEILLADDKFPGRALFAIGVLDDSTLSALARKSADFKKLSLSGRAMVTRIAMCEHGPRFVSFAKSLLNSTDESVQQIGKVALTHRGIATTFPDANKNALALITHQTVIGDFEQLQVAMYLLATPPQATDTNTQQRIEELIRSGQPKPELAEAILLSNGLFSKSKSTTLAVDLVSDVTSRYRVPAYWALHFLDHLKAVSVAQDLLSTQVTNESPKNALLRVEIHRAGTRVEFPTAYSEYLCR